MFNTFLNALTVGAVSAVVTLGLEVALRDKIRDAANRIFLSGTVSGTALAFLLLARA